MCGRGIGNAKNPRADHCRAISSLRHKAVTELRRRKSHTEDHSGLRKPFRETANWKSLFSLCSVFCHISSLAKPTHSQKVHLMYSTQVNLKGSGEEDYRGGQTG